MQRGRGLVEDSASGGVQVMAAMDARPRLALLRGFVAAVNPLRVAVRAVSGLPIGRVAVAPEPLQARFIVGELAHELHQGILRVRRLVVLRVLSVSRCHTTSLLQCSYTVKG